MSEWQIDPSGVGKVLNDVYTQASSTDGLAGAVTADAAQQAVQDVSLGDNLFAGAVPGALYDVMGEVMEDMGKVGNRVVAGVMGVTAATLAYQNGQQDMCGAAEQAMTTAADSGDFSWFKANGYMEQEA